MLRWYKTLLCLKPPFCVLIIHPTDIAECHLSSASHLMWFITFNLHSHSLKSIPEFWLSRWEAWGSRKGSTWWGPWGCALRIGAQVSLLFADATSRWGPLRPSDLICWRWQLYLENTRQGLHATASELGLGERGQGGPDIRRKTQEGTTSLSKPYQWYLSTVL